MSNAKQYPFFFHLLFFLITLFSAAVLVAQGSRSVHPMPAVHKNHPRFPQMNFLMKQQQQQQQQLQDNSRRLLIGSVAPTCSFNECRGCKYKYYCRAEQVPVEANDPINSPYHYKYLVLIGLIILGLSSGRADL